MRKLLTATTALALVGGVAFAETNVDVSFDAKSGLDFTSDPEAGKSKHSFTHEVGVDFSASGTTDGGLAFGGSVGFESGDDTVNEGTVYISGAFGKLTFGDNDSADVLAGGITDIGLNGIDLDDVVEDLRGTTANQFRYDNSFGAISIAISAGTLDGEPAVTAAPGHWTLTNRTTGLVGASVINQSQLAAFEHALKFAGTNGPVNYVPKAPTEDDAEDPFENFRRAAGFVVVHTAAAEGVAEKVEVSLAADGANPLDIAGFSRKGDDVLRADGSVLPTSGTNDDETNALGALREAFEAYAEIYDLGEGEKVGGGNDTPKAVYTDLLHQVTEPIDAADAVPSDNQYAFGMSFEASGVTVGIGHDSAGATSVGLGFSTGDVSASALYVKGETAVGVGADVSYTMGASTLTLAYARQNPDAGPTVDATGIALGHDLGGGASLNAGFGQVEDVSRASIGISFAF